MTTMQQVQLPQTQAAAVDVSAGDVFVIVLVPHNLLDTDICGLKPIEWVLGAVSAFKSIRVDIKKGDDIIGIVKQHAGEGVKKYCVVVYADTPLIKHETIDKALSFAATYHHKAVQLPRGWVFETDYIKSCGNIHSVTMKSDDDADFTVVYNYAQAAIAGTYLRQRINEKHLLNGVNITDPYNVYIDAQVEIGAGTKIGPGVVLRGETKIGKNCRVTNFVEIKKSTIGDGTKISHMSYIGDATIGKNCNIGCGVIFCNYDGKQKHQTTIGDNAFVGSNSNLVAPLVIGENAFIAAGSTITQDVPARALAIARARQAMKEDYKPEA
jgi:bifunctional N-acetylglucosamine-1-phosphate-uridyltransferase/glucosamine-1-phosphate-acetyltransferase GlmU-like protein